MVRKEDEARKTEMDERQGERKRHIQREKDKNPTEILGNMERPEGEMEMGKELQMQGEVR